MIAIRQERRRIETLASLLPSDTAVADQLTQDLLYAEAGDYVADPTTGRTWIDAVHTHGRRRCSRAPCPSPIRCSRWRPAARGSRC